MRRQMFTFILSSDPYAGDASPLSRRDIDEDEDYVVIEEESVPEFKRSEEDSEEFHWLYRRAAYPPTVKSCDGFTSTFSSPLRTSLANQYFF